MNFNMVAKYKVNILYKHSRNNFVEPELRQVSLAYNTSKFNAPISLLIIFLMLSLTLMSPAPYTTATPHLCYVSNLICLVLVPFLTEAVLVL